MRGLLLRTWCEVWLMTLLFGLALMAILALLTFVYPQFQEELLEIFDRLPFIRPMITAMLGSEVGDQLNVQTLQAIMWVHPIVLTLLWAHAIVFCTRVPAGEIDLGTIDVLLGWPVSRRQIYYSEALACLVAGLVILLMGFLGHCLVAPSVSENLRPRFSHALVVLANLSSVYLAVGGIAQLVSALSNRRGRAVATAFAIVVASFLLNLVGEIWEPAEQVAFLGILEYYRPAEILQTGEFPIGDVAVLLCVGAGTSLLGGEIVARRSICTL